MSMQYEAQPRQEQEERGTRRAGQLLFALAFLVGSLILLAFLTDQTAWKARTRLFAQPCFWSGLSVVALILFAPILARVAPMFGSREIFLAALLGIILVVTAHRRQSLIAAALASFGIWINTIGLEPVKYTKRYTFDQSWLSGGVDLIVVVLGMFAISQAFILLTSDDEKVRLSRLKGSFFQGFRELARHPRLASVSVGFGVVMGMIPSVGEFTAQFMSYTYAQKTSKRPEDFGHGSSEGLIAAETSNNAVPAAAMVPLLALGIPGEALTAMMLSVFYVHNVIPGPGLFQNRMDFVVALYLALLILNVLVLVGYFLRDYRGYKERQRLARIQRNTLTRHQKRQIRAQRQGQNMADMKSKPHGQKDE